MLVGDRPLLDAFRRGEPAALEAVYRSYAPELAGLLRHGFSFRSGGRNCRFRGCASTFDLEDRMSETFLRAFSPGAREGYDGLSSYKNYLYTIAKNLVIDDFRKKERAFTEFSVEEPVDDPFSKNDMNDALAGEVVPSGAPERDLESAELVGLVGTFLEGLEGREKLVYELRFQSSMEHKDIMEKTGLSASKVKTSEKRIRERFFSFLQEHGYLGGYEPAPGGWLRLARGRR